MNDDTRNDPTPNADPLATALDELGSLDRARAPHDLADRIASATAHAPPLKLAASEDAGPPPRARRLAPALARAGIVGSGVAAAAAVALLALPLLNSSTATPAGGEDISEVAMIEAELETFLELDSELALVRDGSPTGDRGTEPGPDSNWIDTWLEMDEMLAGDMR